MSKPKILVLDIETVPHTVRTWGIHKQHITVDRVQYEGHPVACGYQWLGDKAVQYADTWKYDSKASRRRMLVKVHKALREADATLTYNGRSFDLKRLNGQFVLFGLSPLPPIPHIDLYLYARKLGYVSSKMDHVVRTLGGGGKVATGGNALWDGYMDGDAGARSKMQKYNSQDVRMTAWLYGRVKPYMTNLPYFGDVTGGCPSCGTGTPTFQRYRHTRVSRVEQLQCDKCGHWSEGKREQLVLKGRLEKKCSECDVTKTIEKFSRNRTAPDGRQHECRECCAKYQTARRKDPRGIAQQRDGKHRFRNSPEGHKNKMAEQRRRRATPEGRAKMLAYAAAARKRAKS